MAINDTTLNFLLQTSADPSGIEKISQELAKLKQQTDQSNQAWAMLSQKSGESIDNLKKAASNLQAEAEQSGEAFQRLGSIVGLSIGGIAAAAVTGFVKEIIKLHENETKLHEEIAKANLELSRQDAEWASLAATAGSFFDVVNLGLKQLPLLQKLADAAAAAQKEQLTVAQKVIDKILESNFLGGSPIARQETEKRTAAQQNFVEALKAATDEQQKAGVAAAKWGEIEAGPVATAIGFVKGKLADLTTQIKAVGDPMTMAADPVKATAAVAKIDELNRQYAVWAQRLKSLQDEQDKLNKAEDRDARLAFNRNLTALLEQQRSVVESIRQQQQLIAAAPFLSADAKQSA